MFFVFTYGSLMQGRGNNLYLRGQKFVGSGIISKHKLFDYVDGNRLTSIFPVVFETGNEDDKVVGEVWACDDSRLYYLDALEDEGTLYERKEIVVDVDNGRKYNCYIYKGIVDAWIPAQNALFPWINEGNKWKPINYIKLNKEDLQYILTYDTDIIKLTEGV